MAALGAASAAGGRSVPEPRARHGAARPSRRIRRLPFPYLVTSAVLPLILLALLIGRLTFGAAPAPLIGSAAPDFTLTDLDGNPVRLADLARPTGDRQLLGELLRVVRRGVPAP